MLTSFGNTRYNVFPLVVDGLEQNFKSGGVGGMRRKC